MESILNNETMYEMMMPVITKLGMDKFGMYNSAERRKKASDSLEPFYNELKKRMMESEIDDLRQLSREDLLKLGFMIVGAILKFIALCILIRVSIFIFFIFISLKSIPL